MTVTTTNHLLTMPWPRSTCSHKKERECMRHLLRRAVFTIDILTKYGLELLWFVILVIWNSWYTICCIRLQIKNMYVRMYSFFLSTPHPSPPPSPPNHPLFSKKNWKTPDRSLGRTMTRDQLFASCVIFLRDNERDSWVCGYWFLAGPWSLPTTYSLDSELSDPLDN